MSEKTHTTSIDRQNIIHCCRIEIQANANTKTSTICGLFPKYHHPVVDYNCPEIGDNNMLVNL